MRHPSSVVHIALLDSDAGAIELTDDDPVGRLELPLSQFYPATLYDGWYAMQQSHVEAPCAATHGRLCLRISVSWRSERARMLAYLSAPPRFELPLANRHDKQAAAFAMHGHAPDSRFRWDVTKTYLSEVYDLYCAVYSISDAVEYVIHYRSPMLSLVALTTWQLVCEWPSLGPACAPLAFLAALHCSYAQHARVHAAGALRTPPFRRLCARLVLPAWLQRAPLALDAAPVRACGASHADGPEPLDFEAELAKFEAGGPGWSFREALEALPDLDSLDWMDPRRIRVDALDPRELAQLGIKGLETIDPRNLGKLDLSAFRLSTAALRDMANPTKLNPIRLLQQPDVLRERRVPALVRRTGARHASRRVRADHRWTVHLATAWVDVPRAGGGPSLIFRI